MVIRKLFIVVLVACSLLILLYLQWNPTIRIGRLKIETSELDLNIQGEGQVRVKYEQREVIMSVQDNPTQLAEDLWMEAVQQDMSYRVSNISAKCRALKQQGVTLHKTHPREFLHFDKLKLGWCPIYKAASSNWKVFFSKTTGTIKKCPETLGKSAYGACLLHSLFQGFNHPRIKPAAEHQNFIVVRHPYERLVSAFRDKVESCDKKVYYDSIGKFAKAQYRLIPEQFSENKEELLKQSNRKVYHRTIKKDDLDLENPYETPLGPTFTEFSKAVLWSQKEDMHWATFESWCTPCNTPFNNIIKFETLNRDNEYLLKRAGLDPAGFSKHENPTLLGGTKTEIWKEYFGELSVDLLRGWRDRFSVDCELFGYDCGIEEFIIQQGTAQVSEVKV